jgi:hypothetical protein
MRLRPVLILAGSLLLGIPTVVALAIVALADYVYTDVNGPHPVFSFVCQSTKLCTGFALIDSTGTEKGTLSNPVVVASSGVAPTVLSVWTSSTSLNATQLLATSNALPAIAVQLDQTSTISAGAVTFEGTFDGINWATIPATQVLNANTFTPLTNPYTLVANTNQPFLILTQGYQQVRIKLSTPITGTGTVTPYVTALPYNPTIGALLNPLSPGSAIIGKVGVDQTLDGTTNGVRQTNQYPAGATALTASATGTTGATTATLAASGGVTDYICGFSIRANATAAVTGNSTIFGTITGTLNFTQWTAPLASGLGVTEMIFSPCVPASGVNTAIAVVSAAPGAGGTVSVAAWGYTK